MHFLLKSIEFCRLANISHIRMHIEQIRSFRCWRDTIVIACEHAPVMFSRSFVMEAVNLKLVESNTKLCHKLLEHVIVLAHE